MWPFSKRKNAQCVSSDPTAIGNLLVTGGYCSRSEVIDALLVQRQSPDILLGEHLVHRGVIEVNALSVVVARQKALRGKKPKAVRELAREAVKQAADVPAKIDQVFGDFLEKVC